MASQQHSRYRRLELAVSQVQRQWGPRALRLLSQAAPSFPVLPTGFVALDAATGIGGFPRGQITELLGPATSGKTTIALIALARAQRCGGIGAYFDLGWTLDPEYARCCGVDLHRLLIVRPHSGEEALAIAANLVRRRGLQLVVFDARPEAWLPASPGPERSLALGLRLLSTALAATPCVALFLTLHEAGQSLSSALDYPGQLPLPESAALRLRVACERWIQRPWADISGYMATIVVAKNRLAAPGRQATVSITFDGAVQGCSGVWSEDGP